jgi:hypothetical protein
VTDVSTWPAAFDARPADTQALAVLEALQAERAQLEALALRALHLPAREVRERLQALDARVRELDARLQ